MKIFLERTFDAAHRLYPPLVPPNHKCCRQHGHTYHVRLELEGSAKAEMVLEYGKVDAIWQRRVMAVVDHRDLNEVFKDRPTTSENLASWIYHTMAQALHEDHPGVDMHRVEVRETATSGAIYP